MTGDSTHGPPAVPGGRAEAILRTERMVLRRLTEADVDLLVELDADPAVMRFLTGGRPTPRDVVRGRILPAMLTASDRGDVLGYWAAFTHTADDSRIDGEFLGWFELRATDVVGEAELGYRLRRRAWGVGHATEGAAALIRLGFERAGLRRVFATTMAVNLASRRVLAKAGLTLFRTFHEDFDDPIDGAEHGEVEYALTRSDWERYGGAGHVDR
ncbi:RimJ/RimL family protein N-acetyltransferase [Actinoalloteichus hoggarensis]|uniref:Uncharacterized protein n=1 Tax=Actinoalloteichus hoggarensis TaxID=1470176 RepID=A0A221W3E3_9PSEU|nr:GNAT family N-acetyltransferase [Actinoalloteichus hoggarensis]ASO20325.1 hypothetical protein AHOG_13410 [Actinoalloteichus hoggarensis]MBB5923363.1 RimJ/RimL family protein N-acetyltransferase [Actinoalloteichus hoggarensis]